MTNIKNLRLKKGLSQEKLAKAIGVSAVQVNKWENHEMDMQVSNAVKLARFFKVSVDEILGLRTIIPTLTEKEARTIDALRALTDADRQYVQGIIEGLILRR